MRHEALSASRSRQIGGAVMSMIEATWGCLCITLCILGFAIGFALYGWVGAIVGTILGVPAALVCHVLVFGAWEAFGYLSDLVTITFKRWWRR
jgi:hypothetical protein